MGTAIIFPFLLRFYTHNQFSRNIFISRKADLLFYSLLPKDFSQYVQDAIEYEHDIEVINISTLA